MRYVNSYSEWAPVRRERSFILIVLVACAIGATTSTAVILSLGDFPITQTGVPPISPRALVRNVGSTEPPTKAAEDRPAGSSLPSRVTSIVSGRDEPVTQPDAEHQVKVDGHQSQNDRQQRSHAPRPAERFAHGFWRSTRFNSRRDDLTSGAR